MLAQASLGTAEWIEVLLWVNGLIFAYIAYRARQMHSYLKQQKKAWESVTLIVMGNEDANVEGINEKVPRNRERIEENRKQLTMLTRAYKRIRRALEREGILSQGTYGVTEWPPEDDKAADGGPKQ